MSATRTQKHRRSIFESLEHRQLMSTYYMAPGGSDSAAGSSAAPFGSFNKAYTVMRGGDTLIVKNGTYNQQQVLTRTVRPPSGSSAAYTVVKAETPGGVVVDGKGTMSPISMDGSPNSPISYIQIDGIVFRHQGYGATLYQVDHIKFTRDGFEDSSDGNAMTFLAGKQTKNILVEDSFAWGSGRYKFATYHSENVIFRRTVARFDRAVATPDPIAVYAIYASNNVELQNTIAIDGDHSEYWQNVDEYSGAYSIPSTDGPSTNITITGAIALNMDMQFGTLTKDLSNININNSVGWHLREGVLARDSANYNHMVFGDIYGPARQTQTVGLNWVEGSDPNNTTTLKNSILMNIKGTAVSNWSSQTNNVFYGNNANTANTGGGSGSVTANPGLKYILSTQGASSAVVGKATDGGDIGANIVKRVGVSGTMYGESGYNTVTGEDLWPFPNEDVIGTFMRSYQYQNLSGNRGFAATGQTLTNYVWNYLGNGNPYAGGTPAPDLPPAAPSSLVATAASSTQVNLSWNDNSNDETGFIVQRQTSGGAWTQVASLGAGTTSYSNTGLTASTAYSYRVFASNAGGNSTASNTATATTSAAAVAAPAAPSGLAASVISSSQINLTWTDNSNNETGFIVQRQTAGGAWTQVAAPGAGTTSYSNTGLTASTAYSYRVLATNTGGTSAASNTASGTTFAATVTAPAAPGSLVTSALSSTSVRLTWSDNSNNETGFQIERQTGSGSFVQLPGVGANVTTFTDSTGAANTQYTYRVRAINSGVASAYTNTSTVTTPAAATNPGSVSITSAQFRHDQSPNSLTYQFNTDVLASLNTPDVSVTNLSTGAKVSPTSWTWDAATRTATFKFAGALPNGNYRATFRAGGVWDSAGNALANAHTLDFFALGGDINRDRMVDINDLNILSLHWQMKSAIFSDGDINGDSVVDSKDLTLISSNWQTSLPATPPTAAVAAIAGTNGPAGWSSSLVSNLPGATTPGTNPAPVPTNPVRPWWRRPSRA